MDFFFPTSKMYQEHWAAFCGSKSYTHQRWTEQHNVGILCSCPVSGQVCPQFFSLIIQFIVHVILFKECLLPENEITFKDLCCFYLSCGHPVDFPRFAPHAHETQSIWDLLGCHIFSHVLYSNINMLQFIQTVSSICTALTRRKLFMWGLCVHRHTGIAKEEH